MDEWDCTDVAFAFIVGMLIGAMIFEAGLDIRIAHDRMINNCNAICASYGTTLNTVEVGLDIPGGYDCGCNMREPNEADSLAIQR
jgi:hypothetical protein